VQDTLYAMPFRRDVRANRGTVKNFFVNMCDLQKKCQYMEGGSGVSFWGVNRTRPFGEDYFPGELDVQSRGFNRKISRDIRGGLMVETVKEQLKCLLG